MGKKKCASLPTGGWEEIYYNLKELAITSFKWIGLPDTINERYLELSLFEMGMVAFFKDDVMGYLALRANVDGLLDVYFEPVNVRVIGGGGYNRSVKRSECAVIYNNLIRSTQMIRLQDFAKRISLIEKTIDINIHAQKTPTLIKTPKSKELTVKNLYQQYENFEPSIVVDENLDMNGITSIDTKAPFVADKLEDEKRKLWNEALSYIGIENNFSEKNERLTANEVLVSNGLAIANRNSKLFARQQACEVINRLFGLNVSVEVNNLSFLEMDSNPTDEGVLEGGEADE